MIGVDMADDDSVLHTGQGSRPIPDPTLLTGQLVDKATAALREVLESEIRGQRAMLDARIDGLRESLETRLNANDKATKLLQDIADKMVATIDDRIASLKELHEEKFHTVTEQFVSVQLQFKERDERTIASKTASDTAVAAALQAQKEAAGEAKQSFKDSIDKSERATQEQITQQRAQIQTSTQTLDGKIEDLKERVTRIEGAAVGIVSAKTEQTTTHQASNQNITLIVGLIVAAIAVITALEHFVR